MPVIVVMVMMVFVVMPVIVVVVRLLEAVHGDGDVRAGDAELLRRLPGEAHAGQAQAVHAVDEGLGVGEQLAEGGHQHVARRAHGAFEVERLHGWIPSIWLIRLAR